MVWKHQVSKSSCIAIDSSHIVQSTRLLSPPSVTTHWQAKAVEAVLKHDQDDIIIAGTGMRKTLTFWMPLFFFPAGHIQVMITPLNVLGKPNVALLQKVGMKATFIGADTATSEN